MCGIAAFFAYGGTTAVDRDQLRRVAGRMSTRGPDADGEWYGLDGRVGLAHRRLSIIDLSERGAQPMQDDGGSHVVVYNGEIYNYPELRARLEARGRVFRSDCDTEVLLHLWAECGPEMVHELRGMFAFALWDAQRRGLFLARDAFGIKPLYWSDSHGVFRAASEVKALLAGGGVDTAPEPAGHVGYFLWGHVPEPYTMHRGIRGLPAGASMWVGSTGPEPARVWSSPTALLAAAIGTSDARRNETSDADTRAMLHEALLDSVRHHLLADVDVGVFLSAGLDSIALASLAAQAGGRLRTVTLGFEEYRGTPNDETAIAEAVARRLGADHRTVWITRDEFRRELPAFLERMDQPTLDGVNTYFVSRAAAQAGLKVALSGLGGDELFGGYPSFRQIARTTSALRFVPRSVGRAVRRGAAPILGRLTSPKYAGLLEYGGDYAGAYLLRRAVFMPWELTALLDPDLARAGLAELRTRERLAETTRGLEHPHLRVAALESTWYMRNQLLRDTDWASMSHSLEVRVPLVDRTLWSTVAPLLVREAPPRKRDVALAAWPDIPADILDRPKTGFTVPVRDWMLEETAGYAVPERGLRGWVRWLHANAA